MDLLIPSTKRQKLDDGNEVDEGSDSDCIIIDVEQKQSINIQPTNIELGDDLDDDIVWVGQTGGQDVLKDLPHIRPDCGANAFSQRFSTANGKFCCQCFCYVCDVRASDCKFWGGTQHRDHCHAYFSIYWNALRKAARRGSTALLQQEHSSSETQLTTHWLDAGKKKGKRSSAQNRPQTLDQFWARAGYTRAPRGSAAGAAAAATRQAADSDGDSDSPVVVLDNAAVAAAAAAVQEEEPFLPFVRIKRETLPQPESPPVPQRHQSLGLCAMNLQQEQQEQQKQQQEQQQACAVQLSPWQQQQQQQHVALGDITNTRGATTPAAVATLAATVLTPADADAAAAAAPAATKTITDNLVLPVRDVASSKSRCCAHSIAATAALQTALGVPAGTPAVAAATAAHLAGPQVKAAEAALHAALADTAAGAGAHSMAAAAALQAAADRPVAAARAKPNSGAHRALAEKALQVCLKASAQVDPDSAAAAAAAATAAATVVSRADEGAHNNATEMATAGAPSGCAIVATDTTEAAQVHTPTPRSRVGSGAAVPAAAATVESAAADARMRGATARIAEQQAEVGAEDNMAAAGVAAAGVAAATAPEQQLPVCKTAKGGKQRTTWQCNGFRVKTPKCGSCGNCLNPQRKQACSVNRERIAQGLPPIVNGAAAHS